MRIPSGSTDRKIYFVAVDATDLKTRETGLSSFTVVYSRDGAADVTYTTPTVAEVDSATMPGVYALTLDEGISLAAGHDVEEYCLHITQASMAPVTRVLEVYRVKFTEGQAATMANSAVDADVERLQGSAIATPSVAGVLEVDVTHCSGAAQATIATQTSVDTIDNFLDTEIATILSDLDDLQTRVPAALVGGRIDASVGAMAAGVVTAAAVATGAIDADAVAADAVTEIQAGLSTLDAAGVRTAVGLAAANLDGQLSAIAAFIDTEVAAILSDTDNIQTRLPAALVGGRMAANAEVVGDKTGYALSAAGVDAIADEVFDGTLTLREIMRILVAAAAGKGSGFPAGPVVYRNPADDKDRITATVDADGNRSAVVLDAS